MKNDIDMRAVRARFTAANRDLRHEREALFELTPLLEWKAAVAAFTNPRRRDNLALYEGAAFLQQRGVYSTSTSTKTVAMALLKRIAKANPGKSWKAVVQVFAPEWAAEERGSR